MTLEWPEGLRVAEGCKVPGKRAREGGTGGKEGGAAPTWNETRIRSLSKCSALALKHPDILSDLN